MFPIIYQLCILSLQVNFNDMEEQTGGERGEEDSVDEYDPDSDFNGNQNEENLGQQLRRKVRNEMYRRNSDMKLIPVSTYISLSLVFRLVPQQISLQPLYFE